MEIKENEIYCKNDGTNADALYSVQSVNKDFVSIAPRFGGFVSEIPVKEFKKEFSHVPSNELAARAADFREMHFDFDDWDQTIPAWSNGDRWNGWGTPYFELSTIRKMIDEGLLDSEYSKMIVLDEGVMTIQALGDPLPSDYDWSKIEALVKAGEDVYDYEIAPGVTIEADLYRKHTITVEGRVIDTYPVGAGSWTWNQYDEPRVQSAPTP